MHPLTQTLICSAVALVSVVAASSAIAAEGTTMNAAYASLQPGTFMRRWLVLGPVPVFDGPPRSDDFAAQEKAFDADPFAPADLGRSSAPAPGAKVRVGGKEAEWKFLDSSEDAVMLDKTYPDTEYAVAYAWAEVNAPRETKALLGIGSDDAVKVWLNGQPVHENWAFRGVVKDDDLVPVTLREGRNTLLLKVLNGRFGWGFSVRVLDGPAMGARLAASAGRGEVENIRLLIDSGANPNAKGESGLTPLQSARLNGYEEIARLLTEKGAKDAPLPPLEQLVDGIFTGQTKGQMPGAAVLVARDGKVVLRKGYGYADVGNRVPITPETRFRIGSITKQFTAASILKLMEEGKLTLDDRLTKWYPDFPRGNEVTVRHLLNHTSGIHSYTNRPDMEIRHLSPIQPDELIAEIMKIPYDFSPGERWLYNNSGYFLLGRIVEKVSGKPYEAYLKENFFAPLGMNDSGIHRPLAVIENDATGYGDMNGTLIKAPLWDMGSWAAGAGAIYSTVGDLHKWNEALFNGKVLKDTTLKQAFTPVATLGKPDPSTPAEEGYGFGWMVNRFRGAHTVSHGGGLPGFLSFLARYPDQKTTVVVLSNYDRIDPEGGSREIAQALLWRDLKPRETLAANPNVQPDGFDALTGEFDFTETHVTITRRGDHLYARPAGQSLSRLSALSETEFFYRPADVRLRFKKETNGKVESAELTQGGRTITGTRAKEAAVKIDPAVLESYAGKYDYGQGMTLTVMREGDRLFAQMTNQPRFQIFPKTETEFFWKVVDAQITFAKDEAGKVTKAIHRQGGSQIEAKKLP